MSHLFQRDDTKFLTYLFLYNWAEVKSMFKVLNIYESNKCHKCARVLLFMSYVSSSETVLEFRFGY